MSSKKMEWYLEHRVQLTLEMRRQKELHQHQSHHRCRDSGSHLDVD
jgi:hypothetical protein